MDRSTKVLMIPLLIAGGSIVMNFVAPNMPELNNHLLNGMPVKASEVVCRSCWGTPMMPTGKGSYSLIAPANQTLIDLSLFQPPKTTATEPAFVPESPML